eukprot:1045035-Amphidinium_carterae.2
MPVTASNAERGGCWYDLHCAPYRHGVLNTQVNVAKGSASGKLWLRLNRVASSVKQMKRRTMHST